MQEKGVKGKKEKKGITGCEIKRKIGKRTSKNG